MTLYVNVIMSFTNFKEEIHMFNENIINNAMNGSLTFKKLLNLLGCDNND